MSSLFRRWTHLLAAIVVGVGLLTALYTLGSGGAQAAGDEDKQADVVVQFDNSATVRRAVTFTGAISGLKALELSGLDVVTAQFSFGAAVCSIEGVGCPAEDCFCGGSTFWGNSFWNGNTWQPYFVGAGSTSISQTGAIEGWRWGESGLISAPATQTLAAAAALTYVAAGQVITDGSYGGSVASSLDAMLAVGANGQNSAEWQATPGAPSLLDYVEANGAGYAKRGAAEAGKLAVGLMGSGGAWPVDAPKPSSYHSATLGAISNQAGFLAWAILGTVALSEPIPVGNVEFLKGLAQDNGGWEWNEGFGVDTNATALAIQALIAAGEPVLSKSVVDGLRYLRTAQNDDGGFSYSPDSPFGAGSDTNSTAWVVQALSAACDSPSSPKWTKNGNTPMDYLLEMQLLDGSFAWQQGQGTNLVATEQAIVALLGRLYPLAIRPLEACDLEQLFLPLM